MTRVYLLLAFIIFFSCNSNHTQEEIVEKDSFRRTANNPLVLLLGTFHFQGEMVDDYKPKEKFEVNMLLPERQKQIEEVLAELEDFKPTIIAIEAMPERQDYYDSLYENYRKHRIENIPDERINIGFELAKRLGLKKVYCIDAKPYKAILSKEDSLKYLRYNEEPDSVVEYWWDAQDRYFNYDDSLIFSLPLKEYLLHTNSDSVNAMEMGYFLVSTRSGTNIDPVGADGWITRYYNRNLRIYSNVQRLGAKPTDRILIIYGSMHMYILKHLFRASPEFELVPLTEILN